MLDKILHVVVEPLLTRSQPDLTKIIEKEKIAENYQNETFESLAESDNEVSFPRILHYSGLRAKIDKLTKLSRLLICSEMDQIVSLQLDHIPC